MAVQQADNPEFKNSMHLMIKQAAKKGYMKVLETLIAKVKEAGIDAKTFLSIRVLTTNQIRTYETPLHCAAAAGKLDVIKFLLAQGADINVWYSGKDSGHFLFFFFFAIHSSFFQVRLPSFVLFERTIWNVWNSSWKQEH